MIDWEKIKGAYLTEDISYQKLAERYQVPLGAIKKQGAAENWVEQRKVQKKNLLTADEDAFRRSRLQAVADQMLTKVAQALSEPETLSGSELRSLAGTLKSIMEIHMIQPPLDEQEQRIKIANLEKQAQKQEESGITVVLEGGLEEYAK